MGFQHMYLYLVLVGKEELISSHTVSPQLSFSVLGSIHTCVTR